MKSFLRIGSLLKVIVQTFELCLCICRTFDKSCWTCPAYLTFTEDLQLTCMTGIYDMRHEKTDLRLIAPITVRSYLYGLFVLAADWTYRYIHVLYTKMCARPYACKVPYISWFMCYRISIAMSFCPKK